MFFGVNAANPHLHPLKHRARSGSVLSLRRSTCRFAAEDAGTVCELEHSVVLHTQGRHNRPPSTEYCFEVFAIAVYGAVSAGVRTVKS